MNLECPSCKNKKFEAESDHLHCSECFEVVRFDEIRSLIAFGKRPIDRKLEAAFKRWDELP